MFNSLKLKSLSSKMRKFLERGEYDKTIEFANEILKLDEENLGQVIYFFEKACAISGSILEVNPFNQPGVEEYKKNMFRLLEKPGY